MSTRRSSAEPPTSGLDLDEVLGRVAHWLPTQGPIKDFIHHNTLHAFEDLPFHEGVAAGARLHGARAAMPVDFFRRAFREGRITESALARTLELAYADRSQRDAARAKLLSGDLETPAFSGVVRGGLRALWTERLGGVGLQRRSHLHLFRLIGGYLDQGLSIWRMPGADRLGFFECVQNLVRESALAMQPFDTTSSRALLKLPARDALREALSRTVGREELYERYLLETLLTMPGWSGLVGECERNPGQLLSPRRVSLLDFVAVTLVAELGCLEHELGPGFLPIGFASGLPAPLPCPKEPPARSEAELLLAVWQDAFEWSYYEPLLGALATNATRASPRGLAAVWAFFCIDDRSCSMRRHLEEVTAEVATFGTAGFFGLDFMYKGSGDAIAGKHCPAPMKPRHLIVEKLAEPRPADTRPLSWRRRLSLESQSNTFFRGWLLSYALGLSAAARLAASVFKPSLAPVVVPPLSTVNRDAHFNLLREGDERSEDGLLLGYSASELAERIESLLRACGADRDWPQLVVLFGHGASSVNNPYFAAYNCGACSGRAGAPNARAFAKAANRAEVRAALRERGLTIPDGTWFVGAVVDTTRDEATYYDLDRVPAGLRGRLEAFQRSMDSALARNAAERCRRFESVPLGTPPERALEEVRLRAISLFEVRPEYNHATDAALVIAPRELTSGLMLDRRVFLNSYEPSRDPDGALLTSILSAAVPVCAGINLEYFFSRLDPRVYGAGTKLPHNVNGLLGVCNGVEGDLLTGLPTQMTEVHDPVRLMVVVEQTPDAALEAAKRNPSVFELVDHEWIRYGCLDPRTKEIWMYLHGRMVKLDGLKAPGWRWPTSLDAARQSRENLPIGFVGIDGRASEGASKERSA